MKVKDAELVISDWVGKVELRIAHRGTIDTIKWIKLSRLCYTRYLAGQPFTQQPDPCISIKENGLPRCGLLTTLMESKEVSVIRLVNTLLLISRLLPGTKDPDLSSVIAPSTSVNCELFHNEIKAVIKDKKWSFPIPLWNGVHLSTKAGPNSQAMMGSLTDISLLTEEMLSAMSTLTGGKVISVIENLRSLSLPAWNKYFDIKPKGLLSKLSIVKDKEAKCRIIAIIDYWSQSSLRPLSLAIFSLLKKIKNDCTYDQSKFRACLPKHGPYYSYDLTAATDRFPVEFQRIVVAELVQNEEYANAWKSLISNRDFYVPWDAGTVKYSCGQPMGAYSSWAVFTISHHITVAIAAKRCGLHNFKDYALLGDDIVIANTAVAQEYTQILGSLGVSISDVKSHVSDDTYEFAKRWIHKGEEVTGAPMSLIVGKVKPKWFDLVRFIQDVETRWLHKSYTLASRGLFAEMFTKLGVTKGYSLKLASKAYIFHQFPLATDSPSRLMEKSIFLTDYYFKGDLGCSRQVFSKKVLWAWLGFGKSKLVSTAIKKSVQGANDLLSKVASIPDLFPEGLDSQSILMDIVPVAVARRNTMDLQLTLDKIKAFISSGRGRSITLDPSQYHLGMIPEDILSTKPSQLELYANVTVLYNAKRIALAIMKDRELAALPDSDDNRNPWKNFQKVMST